MPRRLIPALWATAVLLSFIGIVAASLRVYSVATAPPGPAHEHALARTDSLEGDLAIRAQGWTSPEDHAAYFGFVKSFAYRWYDHPRYSVLHLIPGALMLVLMPLQFVRRIRARHIQVHRWSGRIILALGVGVAISATYFGIVRPFVPGAEPVTIGTFVVLFVYFGTRGFIAIKRKQIDAHRRWMIRTYAVVIAIATVRLVALPLAIIYDRPEQSAAALMTAFWVGWVLTLAGAEWWLRSSDPIQARG